MEIEVFLEIRHQKTHLLSELYSILEDLTETSATPFSQVARFCFSAYEKLMLASSWFDWYAMQTHGLKHDVKQLVFKEQRVVSEKREGLKPSDFQKKINELTDLFFSKIVGDNSTSAVTTQFNLLLLEASWLVDLAVRCEGGGLHVVE